MKLHPDSVPAVVGWAGIAAVVLAADAFAIRRGKRTLSAVFRGLESPLGARMARYAVWMALTWHLTMGHKKILPEKHQVTYRRYHPLYASSSWITPKKIS